MALPLAVAERATYEALFLAEHFLGPRRARRWLGAVRHWNRRRLASPLQGFPLGQRRAVPEIAFSSHRVFADTWRRRCEPAVFRGMANKWPAVREWGFDFFAERYGDAPVILIDQPGLIGDLEPEQFQGRTLGEVIAAIRSGERAYLRFSTLMKDHEELKSAFDLTWLRGFRPLLSMREEPQFFLGPASTYTPLHCALTVNLFVQVRGRKRWLIYPARDMPFLEPEADRRPYFHSDWHPERPVDGFALAPFAPVYEVTLEEGDVLYNPPLAFHTVENLTPSISVGYRFYDLRLGLRSSWLMTVLTFLATRPSLLHSLYYSLTGTNFLHERRRT